MSDMLGFGFFFLCKTADKKVSVILLVLILVFVVLILSYLVYIWSYSPQTSKTTSEHISSLYKITFKEHTTCSVSVEKTDLTKQHLPSLPSKSKS